jgi:hypothetical protein
LGGSCFEAIQGKQFKKSHLQNNQSKMGWRVASSGRVPASQVRNPEVKHKSHKKIKRGK